VNDTMVEKASVVDDVLRDAGFSTSAISEVKGGGIHHAGSFNSSASDKELSVKLAFHIKITNLDTAKEIYLNSPLKKEYDPTVESLGMITAVDGDGDGDGLGSIDDFSCMKLGDNYTKVINKLYNSACPGFDLNLSKEEIVMFQQQQQQRKDVTKCLHQVLLNRYRAYKQYGLNGIQPYARSSTNNFYPGEELRAQMEAGWIIPETTSVQGLLLSGQQQQQQQQSSSSSIFIKYALDYPTNPPPGVAESFFWVTSIIDGIPTIALIHRMGMPDTISGGYVYMERHFYISRSHNCLQGIGAAMPVGDGGAVVLYCTRTSTDQVSGMGGTLKRTIGNKMMGNRMKENFERARQVLERTALPPP
jgi:hypothetical protein